MTTRPANPAPSVLTDAEWQRLSPRTQKYVYASFDLLGKSEDYLRDGDLRQASEKGWGAAAQIIKAVAENWKAYGAKHTSHRDLVAMAVGLANLDAASAINARFRHAQRLHENFYEDDFLEPEVRTYLQSASLFVDDILPRLQHPAPPQDFRPC